MSENLLDAICFIPVNYNLTEEELNRTVIDSMKRGVLDGECSVCLSDISGDIYLTGCVHCYHKECLQEWVAHSNESCPLCRTSLIIEKTFRIFDMKSNR
ncbi:probable E3 ubiquitin-protein ligase XERICO [Harmonia axyridis]|uniref:probable E3 ubiquitin-protein ligase XERICO n=1 Tax=Harmonia axyridis TaxID=115357 RepID=UPI001E2751F1|nr:probable E3 ubiquitin-protein ligase XERICO [Harmonia axyridis]